MRQSNIIAALTLALTMVAGPLWAVTVRVEGDVFYQGGPLPQQKAVSTPATFRTRKGSGTITIHGAELTLRPGSVLTVVRESRPRDRSATTRIATRLERGTVIASVRSSSDRERKLLVLTPSLYLHATDARFRVRQGAQTTASVRRGTLKALPESTDYTGPPVVINRGDSITYRSGQSFPPGDHETTVRKTDRKPDRPQPDRGREAPSKQQQTSKRAKATETEQSKASPPGQALPVALQSLTLNGRTVKPEMTVPYRGLKPIVLYGQISAPNVRSVQARLGSTLASSRARRSFSFEFRPEPPQSGKRRVVKLTYELHFIDNQTRRRTTEVTLANPEQSSKRRRREQPSEREFRPVDRSLRTADPAPGDEATQNDQAATANDTKQDEQTATANDTKQGEQTATADEAKQDDQATARDRTGAQTIPSTETTTQKPGKGDETTTQKPGRGDEATRTDQSSDPTDQQLVRKSEQTETASDERTQEAEADKAPDQTSGSDRAEKAALSMEQLKRYERTLKTLRKQLRQRQDKLKNYRDRINRLKKAVSKYKTTVRSLKKKSKKRQTKIKKQHAQKQNLQSARDRLRKTKKAVSALKKRLKKLNDQRSKLKKRITNLTDTVQALRERVRSERQARRALRQNYNQTIERLRRTVDNPKLDQQIDQLKDLLSQAQTHRKTLTERLKRYKNRNRKINRTLRQLKSKTEDRLALNTVKKLKKQLRKAQKARKTLRERLQTRTKALNKSKRKAAFARNMNQSLKQTIDKQAKKYEQTITAVKRRNSELKKTVDRFNERYRALRRTIEQQLRLVLKRQNSTVRELADRTMSLREKLTEKALAAEQKRRIEQQLHSIQTTLSTIKGSLSDASGTEAVSVQKTINNLDRRLDTARQRFETLTSIQKRAEHFIRAYTRYTPPDVSTDTADLKKLSNVNKALSNQRQALQKLREQHRRLQKRYRSLKQQGKNRKAYDVNEKLRDLIRSRRKLQKQTARLAVRQQALIETYAKKLEKREQKLTFLRETAGEYERLSERASTMIRRLKKQLKSNESGQLKKLRQTKTKLQRDRRALQKKINNLQEANRLLKKRLNQKEGNQAERLKKLRKKIDLLRQNFRKKLRSAKKTIRAQKKASKQKANNLKEANETLRKRLKQLKNRATKAKPEKAKRLRKQIKQLNSELQALKAERQTPVEQRLHTVLSSLKDGQDSAARRALTEIKQALQDRPAIIGRYLLHQHWRFFAQSVFQPEMYYDTAPRSLAQLRTALTRADSPELTQSVVARNDGALTFGASWQSDRATWAVGGQARPVMNDGPKPELRLVFDRVKTEQFEPMRGRIPDGTLKEIGPLRLRHVGGMLIGSTDLKRITKNAFWLNGSTAETKRAVLAHEQNWYRFDGGYIKVVSTGHDEPAEVMILRRASGD